MPHNKICFFSRTKEVGREHRFAQVANIPRTPAGYGTRPNFRQERNSVEQRTSDILNRPMNSSILLQNSACVRSTANILLPSCRCSNGRTLHRQSSPGDFLIREVFGRLDAFADGRSLVQFIKKGRGGGGPFARAQTTNEMDGRSWSPLGVSHRIGDMVADKYRIIGVLGRGAVGTTYEAEIEDGTTVALKALSLRSMKDWKDLELFEREARVLKSLQHPGIPQYIDYFEVGTSSDQVFYIVQKVANGKSLADLLISGWRVTEDEVIRIALELLEVLKYLGSLRPPVYHRDIKPENVILDEDTGTVKVVDFGAVQDAASVTLIGSTVVGTYGYMAPEQFQNRATLQTDLYGLGGTLLFLLTGRSPSSFPQKRLKVDFSCVIMSPGIRAVLDKLLEPAPEDRFQSSLEVITALKNANKPLTAVGSITGRSEIPLEQQNSSSLRQPAGSKVDLQRSTQTLEITIPPIGLTGETAGTGSFTLAWNAFLVLWTRTAFAASGTMALFSLPFWFVGVGLARDTLSKLTVEVNLKFEKAHFSIEWRLGRLWKHRVAGRTDDIISVEVFQEGELNRRSITACRIVEGVNRHNFGSGLESIEKYWIVQEIRDFLGFQQLETGPWR